MIRSLSLARGCSRVLVFCFGIELAGNVIDITMPLIWLLALSSVSTYYVVFAVRAVEDRIWHIFQMHLWQMKFG